MEKLVINCTTKEHERVPLTQADLTRRAADAVEQAKFWAEEGRKNAARERARELSRRPSLTPQETQEALRLLLESQ